MDYFVFLLLNSYSMKPNRRNPYWLEMICFKGTCQLRIVRSFSATNACCCNVAAGRMEKTQILSVEMKYLIVDKI